MGVPTSEVGSTSATARRGDPESSYEHVVALERKYPVDDSCMWMFWNALKLKFESWSVTGTLCKPAKLGCEIGIY